VSTAQTLDKVNERFYARFADAFDQSRHHGWHGWHDLLPLLPSTPLTILDLGCGNGRLAEFMDRRVHAESPVELYVGKDRCTALLEHAAHKKLSFPTRFETWTWHGDSETAAIKLPENERYDWVTLFGVMHHVFGYSARLELLRKASQMLKPGGVLSVSFWDFGASEKFLKKTIPWTEKADEWALDPSTLEAGDYLLGWGGHRDTPRYCHWVSPQEQSQLEDDMTRVGPRHLSTAIPTGKPDDLNRYCSWRLSP